MLSLCGVLAVAAVLCWPELAARRRLALRVVARRPTAAHVARPRRAWWRRSDSEHEAVLLELLGAVAAGLSAGLTPSDAVTAAGAALEPRLRQTPQLASWLTRLAEKAGAGEPVGGLWIALGAELNLPVAAQVGRAWSVSERLGSPLMDAVRATTAAHETAARLDRAFAAQSAGPHATVQVLTLLPVLGLALMPVLGVDVVRAYPPPVLLLVVLPGLALLLIGRAVTVRMVQRALRTPPLQ